MDTYWQSNDANIDTSHLVQASRWEMIILGRHWGTEQQKTNIRNNKQNWAGFHRQISERELNQSGSRIYDGFLKFNLTSLHTSSALIIQNQFALFVLLFMCCCINNSRLVWRSRNAGWRHRLHKERFGSLNEDRKMVCLQGRNFSLDSLIIKII